MSETVDDSLPDAIKPGMLIESLNGLDVRKTSFMEITTKLRGVGRPLTVRFRSTTEHEVHEMMVNKFCDADSDETGALNREELATVIQQMHREEGVKRSLEVVQREVEETMHCFDMNDSGELNFLEFVTLMMRAPNFKFKLDEAQKRNVMDLCEIMASKMAHLPQSPISRRVRHLEKLSLDLQEEDLGEELDLEPSQEGVPTAEETEGDCSDPCEGNEAAVTAWMEQEGSP